MQSLSFRELKSKLEAAGAAPSTIDRITRELEEHCCDAAAAAEARGLSPKQALREARSCLGSCDAIVEAVRQQPSLLDWRHRWPQSARMLDTAAYWLCLPAAPFVYCCSYPSAIVRWSLSSSLALFVTASILFGMQLLISLGMPV